MEMEVLLRYEGNVFGMVDEICPARLRRVLATGNNVYTAYVPHVRNPVSCGCLSRLQSAEDCLRHLAEGTSTGSESDPGGQRQGPRGRV